MDLDQGISQLFVLCLVGSKSYQGKKKKINLRLKFKANFLNPRKNESDITWCNKLTKTKAPNISTHSHPSVVKIC